MPQHLILIFPINSPVCFQSSSRPGCFALLQFPICLPRLGTLCFSFAPLLASSLPSLFRSSFHIEHSSLVNHPIINALEPTSAAILIDSVTYDFLRFPPRLVEAFSRVVTNNLHPPTNLYNWDWPFSWKTGLCEPYQLGTQTLLLSLLSPVEVVIGKQVVTKLLFQSTFETRFCPQCRTSRMRQPFWADQM